jgi:hypothetical protein
MHVVLFLLLAGTSPAADRACQSTVCPLHRVAHAAPAFDTATLTTVSGRVQRVLREDHGGWVGVHLELATDAGTVRLALGPALFVDLYARFEPEDVVTATGSRVTKDGAPLLLTTSLARGAQVVEFRTRDGQPLF